MSAIDRLRRVRKQYGVVRFADGEGVPVDSVDALFCETIRAAAAVCKEHAEEILTGAGNALVRSDRFLIGTVCAKRILSALNPPDSKEP